MMIQIDPNSGVPTYRQLIDQIRFQAVTGMLAAGSELPSTRALSQELGLNPMTVSKAYGLLEAEGVIERRPGLPLVVRARPPEDLERERDAQLRAMLEPAARAARQLGLSPPRAIGVFRAVLEESVNAKEEDLR